MQSKAAVFLKRHDLAKFIFLGPIRRLRMARDFLKRKFNFNRIKYGFPSIDMIYFINPNDIVWHTNYQSDTNQDLRNRNFESEKHKGAVLGGNWDEKLYKFSELAVYQAIRDRIEQGMEWSDTAFFKESLIEIESGKVLWGCHNRVMLLERCLIIDKIIDNIKHNGFKIGYESRLPNEDPDSLAKRKGYSEEITVNIGRNGDFFFQDGRHRLAIAKVLNIESIPVKVLVRHTLWCEKLRRMAHGEKVDGFLGHPEVQYILASQRVRQ
jgi:hypothetical protein